MLKKIHISVGDLNGISAELLLTNHNKLLKICQPFYHTSLTMLSQASQLLNIPLPNNLSVVPIKDVYKITPAKTTIKSGYHSFCSFESAVNNTLIDKNSSLLTMPISKKSWDMANIKYLGHTDYFRQNIDENVVMMLGCDKHYVMLYSDHIPLRQVPTTINEFGLIDFLYKLASYLKEKTNQIKVLGINPHAGEEGLIGDEDLVIKKAIKKVNQKIENNMFSGPFPADSYFYLAQQNSITNYTVAIYHDQGLIGVKTLYFDQSIQVSLGLPFLRTSPDHGPAFDIAYKNNKDKSSILATSYLNAINYLVC
ncbi:MAG: 4-hydroxythreonine-4-phosphate dehydrogenase PdxA [SAR324 cluster bacterium]|nr:4-hydroxythreonine-4-phosphate dehydrogenase PdxA [SAR324 cluster bacterium]